jgi:hypothetical protein
VGEKEEEVQGTLGKGSPTASTRRGGRNQRGVAGCAGTEVDGSSQAATAHREERRIVRLGVAESLVGSDGRLRRRRTGSVRRRPGRARRRDAGRRWLGRARARGAG